MTLPAGRAAAALVAIVPLVAMLAVAVVVAGHGDRILAGLGHNPPPADDRRVGAERRHAASQARSFRPRSR